MGGATSALPASFSPGVDTSFLHIPVHTAISEAAPVAVDDEYERAAGSGLSMPATSVLSNDSDPSGLSLTATLVRPPARGTVTLHPDGSFTYAPDNPASTVADEFAYRASNGASESSAALVQITLAIPANAIASTDAIDGTNTTVDCSITLGSGVTYTPFILECTDGAFSNIWNSERGDTPITFYQSNGAGGMFLPLGDIAVIGQSLGGATPPPGTQMLFAPPSGDSTLLAHPVGFSWILNDKNSGNGRNINYFAMVPPEGYVALGIAFSAGDLPNPNNYWCVRSDLVRPVPANGVWSDAGSHWTSHDGNLSAPVASPPMSAPYLLFAPPTLLSAEGGTPAYALVMRQADLQIHLLDVERPHRRRLR